MATPFMKGFALKLVAEAATRLGLDVFVVDVDRDYKVQMALYAQGRQPLDEVNLLRKVAGLGPIKEEQNERVVTWTMASKHIIRLDDTDPHNDQSRAVDFGIRDPSGKYVGDVKADVNYDNEPDYIQLALLAEEIGGGRIKAGARFKNKKGEPCPDYPHFEEA
jgi:peptidoglycan L-alanyl-D-glutamate endopeptidase CwlK